SPAFAGVSPSDVFIVGDSGVLAHFDGSATESLNGLASPLYDLFGDESGDAWAVGGSIFRRHNGRWSIIVPDITDLWAVSGSSIDDVWIAGGAVALHWEGHAFTQLKAPDNVFLAAVWVSTTGHAFFPSSKGLYRADANGFTRVVEDQVTVAWGTSESDM